MDENKKNSRLLFTRIDTAAPAKDMGNDAKSGAQPQVAKKRGSSRRRTKKATQNINNSNVIAVTEKTKPATRNPRGQKSNGKGRQSGNAHSLLNESIIVNPGKNEKIRIPENRNANRLSNASPEGTLRVIPLGGLGEVGKNMTVYEYGNDMFIVDCGLMFPDDELFGVDIVIPDFTYVIENKDKLRGMIITHGHEDHIGGIPYFLKELPTVPIYGSKLTVGLIRSKLVEHKLDNVAKLNSVEIGQTVNFGCMKVETIGVNHSIPGAMAVAIKTPIGTVVQTGDFKVDYTPVFDKTIDLVRFGQLGSEGVLALLADSTNVENPGNSVTESNVGRSLEMLFSRAEGKRLIIATFASNIQRVKQIIDLAVRHKRKIALSGRSMENYTAIARELGYLKFDESILIGIDEIKNYRPSDIIIITTGSQGEPMSALSRMAAGTHKQVAISSGDVIIISATPIPGNEKSVTKIINDLLKLGSDVVYEKMYEAHASGHACQDELKLMMQLTKPKFFIPVHGEYKHLVKHKNLAMSLGIDEKNIVVADIGQVIELTTSSVSSNKTVTSGRVLVDGLGVGDVGSVVLRDRKHLSQDGLLAVVVSVDMATKDIISGPDIISRGFVYVKESEQLIDEAREFVKDVITDYYSLQGKKGKMDIRIKIREELGKMMYQKTMRNPMIIPVVMEI